MTFFLLCFFYICLKYMRNNSNLLVNYKTVYEGNNSRYPINDTNNEEQIYILQNNEISVITKSNLLNYNNIKPINLTASGVMYSLNFTDT
jgi:hypothetical protein